MLNMKTNKVTKEESMLNANAYNKVCRSDCKSTQSNQHLCWLLPKLYNFFTFYNIQNLKELSSKDMDLSYMVGNLKTCFPRTRLKMRMLTSTSAMGNRLVVSRILINMGIL